MAARFGAEPAGGVFGGELAEVFVEFGFFDLVGADAEVLEEGLVELPAGAGVDEVVGVLELGGEVEHLVQDVAEFEGVVLGDAELLFGLGEFGPQGGLFVGEDVDREGVGEVGVEQFALLGFGGGDALALAADLALVVFAHPGERLVKRGAHVVEVGDPAFGGGGADLFELHVGVFGGDLGFGGVGGEVGQAAAGAADAPYAGEVGVDRAVLAFGLDEGQPRAAAGADQ